MRLNIGLKKTAAALTAAALLFGGVLGLAGCKKTSEDPTVTESTEDASSTEGTTAAPIAYKGNPLTGEADYDEAYAGQKFVGIVVENSPAARPQWGMSTPDILMEYEVEGGISRMLWLYANTDRVPEKVGPVRSARHDIVELARGWDLLFVHCGGSPQALNKIKGYGGALSEIEGLSYGGCFVRDTTRNVSSEHRYVLLGDKFRDSVKSLNLNMEQDPGAAHPFAFAETARTLAGEDAAKIHFEYSDNYKYDFTFNAETGKYEASINGRDRVDDKDIRCAYTNVIVLYVPMESVGDKDGHQDLKLENGGAGLYLCGGKMEEIKWEKGGDADPLRLLTSEGEALQLNAGNSYIGLVRAANSPKTRVG